MKPGGKETQVPPDGGWGWFIVLGSSLINLSTRSIEPSFGLLFGDLLKQLGVATTGAAVIISTRDAVINFSGFFMGPLIKKYSYRKVGILGAILSSSALLATASASSMTHILLTYSLIGGFGFGMTATVTFVALNGYFEKRRGQAFGLAMAGTALGFMVMPQIISRLLEEFGFHYTMIIMGALGLNALVGASLLQPVKWHMKTVFIEEEETFLDERKEAINTLDRKVQDVKEEPSLALELPKNNSFSTSLNLQRQKSKSCLSVRRKNSFSSVSHLDLTDSMLYIPLDRENNKDVPRKLHRCKNTNLQIIGAGAYRNRMGRKTEDVAKKNEMQTQKDSCWQKLISIMDFDLLLDITFLNTIFGLSIAYIAELNFKLVMPFFMANLGYTKRETAQALSLMAIADIIARLLIPPICDRLPYSRRNTLILALVLVMIARSVLAEQTTWTNLMVAIVIHGFFRGFALINFPLVVAEAVVKEKLPSAYGLYMVSKGIFVVVLGPVGGWIRDYTGSYSICLHAQSAMIMSCVVAWALEYFFTKTKRNEPKIPKENS